MPWEIICSPGSVMHRVRQHNPLCQCDVWQNRNSNYTSPCYCDSFMCHFTGGVISKKDIISLGWVYLSDGVRYHCWCTISVNSSYSGQRSVFCPEVPWVQYWSTMGMCEIQLCWADPGCMPGASQNHSIALPPRLNRGEKKQNKTLVGWGKDRRDDSPSTITGKQTWLGEKINLLPIKLQ